MKQFKFFLFGFLTFVVIFLFTTILLDTLAWHFGYYQQGMDESRSLCEP